MDKLLIGVLGLLVAVIFGNALGFGQGSDGEMCVPMGIIVLEPPDSVEAKKTPIEFPHSLHFTHCCQTCHHEWKGTEEISSCTASGCHDLTVSPIKERKDTNPILYYKEAYHTMCIGCHKDIRVRNKELEMSKKTLTETLPPAGPTGCIGCHPREE